MIYLLFNYCFALQIYVLLFIYQQLALPACFVGHSHNYPYGLSLHLTERAVGSKPLLKVTWWRNKPAIGMWETPQKSMTAGLSSKWLFPFVWICKGESFL